MTKERFSFAFHLNDKVQILEIIYFMYKTRKYRQENTVSKKIKFIHSVKMSNTKKIVIIYRHVVVPFLLSDMVEGIPHCLLLMRVHRHLIMIVA